MIKINIYSVMLSVTLMFIVGNSTKLSAKTNIIPEPFRGQDKNSTIVISYEDYNELLKISVLDMGKSTREKSPKASAKIGSRFKSKRKAYTDMEGNRFLFRNFKHQENKILLTKIRKSLELVPDEVAMSLLNPKEQLAFWLNLYNISLIEQIVDIYPTRNIEEELYADNGIMENKFIKISGIDLSLNDIHKKIILGKFSANPIVIYGLFQGTIGGPNIRATAYTGASVVKQLRENATEFINSNRGTFKVKEGTLKVSSFYEHNKQLFPHFNKDLIKHLNYYIDDSYSQYFENLNIIQPVIKNMSIADLTGGRRKFSSSSNTNAAALENSISGNHAWEQNTKNAVAAANGGRNSEGVRVGVDRTGIHGLATTNLGELTSRLSMNFAKDYGRYSPDTVQMLMKMKQKSYEHAKAKNGEVIIKREGQ